MNIYIIIAILAIHWLADFVLQTDWQAKNKSKNNEALLDHTCVYSWVWFFIVFGFTLVNYHTIIGAILAGGMFTCITFFCHTITDYFTSRLNSRLWEKKKIHWFFVSVGFDQLLHYIQLLLTYKLIFG